MKRESKIGWTATILSTLVACLWAVWGSIENFHEGWWAPELYKRLLGTLAYLGPMLISISRNWIFRGCGNPRVAEGG